MSETKAEAEYPTEYANPCWLRMVFVPSYLDPVIEQHTYPGSGTPENPYVVSWIRRDPRNPFNWSPARRWSIAMLAAVSCFAVAFTSSAYTGGINGVVQEFHTTNAVAQLGVSLFVLGFAIGPLFWGPMSEAYGRQPILIATLGALVLSNILSASATSIVQLLVFRALAGE